MDNHKLAKHIRLFLVSGSAHAFSVCKSGKLNTTNPAALEARWVKRAAAKELHDN